MRRFDSPGANCYIVAERRFLIGEQALGKQVVLIAKIPGSESGAGAKNAEKADVL